MTAKVWNISQHRTVITCLAESNGSVFIVLQKPARTDLEKWKELD